ncbi:MAG: alpha/beta hydrolase [Minisyncoccia bacterium]
MKKVFIIHGFQGSPNGGWRPWLMAELEKQDIYACALSMPKPDEPICNEWVEEISRYVEVNKNDDIYLIGHSLGVPAILHYLENSQANSIKGVVIVSGPSEKNNNRKIDSFLETPFDFESIKSKCKSFSIIHGDNDPNVPLDNAKTLSKELNSNLIIVENGGHLNGSAGWTQLPQCLEVLNVMMK